MSLEKVLPRLVPPSEAEARDYYHGLPSKPRLVGRTSAGIVKWEAPIFDDEQGSQVGFARGIAKRMLSPVGDHKIHMHHKAILPKIIKAVGDLPWTSIDVVRLGYDTVPVNERPVVVWVGVWDAKLPWPVVAEALRAVRLILDTTRFLDVECELRLAQVLRLGGPPLFEPMMGGKFGREGNDQRPMSTSVGQPISSVDHQFIEGTLGIYVCSARVTNPRTWALTCRHVALPPQHYRNETYNRLHDDHQGQEMVLPSFSARQTLIHRADTDAKRHRKELERGGDQDFNEKALAYLEKFRKFLDDIGPIDQRTFGRVSLAPPLTYAKGKHPWTRDWALIALDTNKVLPERTRNVVDLRSKEYELDALPEIPTLRDGFFPLVGTVPIAELEHIGRVDPKERFPVANEKKSGYGSTDGHSTKRERPTFNSYGNRCLIVGKRGGVSGLTWGVSNDLESVVRHFDTDEHPAFTSRAWAICGSLNRSTTPFSKQGDSGAAIFDMAGRVLGQLVSGSSGSEAIDVTYATPMEFLLEDISMMLGKPVRLL